MISEHGFPTEHGHPVVPYYLHSGRPDVPLFIPRGAPLPGPPPLLASKRDGGDPHAVSPYFQGVYPPSIMDSPDMHFETWRQQRAVEHLRQQHERQERPMPSMSGHSDLASPKDNTSDKDKAKEGGSSGEPSGHRMYYYNESKPSSCPVHGHSPGEPHQHKHPVSRAEQMPTTKPDRPDEYNRMFLPPHPDGPAMLHPYIVHPSREGPFGPQHLGERQAEMLRERERQEIMIHQRMMLDSREHMKAREEEWQRRQQRLRQEKEEHHREMAQYRHHVLQQQREMEQPRRAGEQGSLDHRRPDHRQDHRERSDKSPHTNERPGPENEIYRHYPFHHPFHPLQHDIRVRLPYPDLSRKDGEAHRSHMEAMKDGRNPHPHPFGLHDPHFRPFSDPYPFHQDRLSSRTSGADRLFTEARWPTHTRPTYMNGDLRTVDIHPSDIGSKMSEGLSARIKKENMIDLSNTQPTIKRQHHDKEKLKFLEGLGLVTLEKKKELTHGDPGVKRKFEEPQETPPQDDKASTVSNGTREETEETSSEGTTDVESGTTSTDTEILSKHYKEKVNFMARLGLVPPQTREEMEQSYEVKRSERKKRKKKGRGRPSKRLRKETVNNESENGRTSIDAENLGGPLTRQKQQQLLEQGLLKQDTEDKPEENGELNRDLSIKIKKEAGEEASSSYPYGTRENRYKSSSDSGHYHRSPPISSESLASRPPPRLTLQSLTNMEDPFNNYNTPTFRPPYLRHTGLLSVSQDSNHHGGIPIGQPLRPEPIRSTGISLSEQETREYLSHRRSPGGPPEYNRHYGMLPGHQGTSYDKVIPVHSRAEVDAEKRDLGTRVPLIGRKEHEYKWPGVESVMKAYFLHSGERDHELSFLQDNANKLKSQHASLNEEASNLNTQMTNLVQTKKHLNDEKKVCRENLDRLHYFMQSFQR